jgi:hypothetical protein
MKLKAVAKKFVGKDNTIHASFEVCLVEHFNATLTKRGDNSLVNLNSNESINISIKEEGVQYNLLNTVIKINKIETTYFDVIYEDEALIREFYDSGSTELKIRIKFKPKVGKYIKYSLKITL